MIYLYCMRTKTSITGTVDLSIKDSIKDVRQRFKKRNFSDALEFVLTEGLKVIKKLK